MAEASSLAKERQAVEAHKAAAEKRLAEQQKLAYAEAELMRIQLQMAGTIPPDVDAGAAGDDSSSISSSSSSDEDEVQPGASGEKASLWFACCKFVTNPNKIIADPGQEDSHY